MNTIKNQLQKNQIQQQLLNFVPNFALVQRYTPQRSVYDKTSYIENYIPRNTPYHRKRKPQLQQWTDPETQWPKLNPAPTKNKFKALIQEVEKEQQQIINIQRDFIYPDFRAGDVIQFKYMHGLSEEKSNIYTGIVIGRKRKNSMSALYRVIFRFCGVEVYMSVMQNSPFVKDFKLLHRGSGNLRSQLTYLWNDRSLTADQIKRPILKGKKPIKRGGDAASMQNQITKSNVNYDTYRDPIFDQV